jgi:hypothetical protein
MTRGASKVKRGQPARSATAFICYSAECRAVAGGTAKRRPGRRVRGAAHPSDQVGSLARGPSAQVTIFFLFFFFSFYSFFSVINIFLFQNLTFFMKLFFKNFFKI